MDEIFWLVICDCGVGAADKYHAVNYKIFHTADIWNKYIKSSFLTSELDQNGEDSSWCWTNQGVCSQSTKKGVECPQWRSRQFFLITWKSERQREVSFGFLLFYCFALLFFLIYNPLTPYAVYCSCLFMALEVHSHQWFQCMLLVPCQKWTKCTRAYNIQSHTI